MPETKSTAFRRFIESLNPRGQVWMDIVDEPALMQLAGDERHEAEQMLLERIGAGDERVARALARLDSQVAIPVLNARLSMATGIERIAIASALWKLASLPASIDTMLEEANAGDEDVRRQAMIALSGVPPNVALPILKRGLSDGSRKVRDGAAFAILRQYGMAKTLDFIRQFRDTLGKIGSPDRDIQMQGEQELLSIVTSSGREPQADMNDDIEVETAHS